MPHDRPTYRREPARCTCEPGNVAHTQHCRPGNRTGAHLDPRCRHSELLNTTSRYAERRAEADAKRRSAADILRARQVERSRLVR